MKLASLKKIQEHTAVRYIVVGGLSYGIEVSILFMLVSFLHVSSLVGVGISFWVGLAVSFLLQKFLAFSNTTIKTEHLFKQSVQYGLLVVINYAFTLWFVSAFESMAGLLIARTVALVITTMWNYFVYAKIIFKKGPSHE